LSIVAVLLLAGGAALAMDPPGLPAGGAAVAATRDEPSWFSLDSPLADSPWAQGQIRTRLAEWEREKLSLRLLAEGRGRYCCEEMQALLAEIRLDLRLATKGDRQDRDDWISNPQFRYLSLVEFPALLETFNPLMTDILATWSKQEAQFHRFVALLEVFDYDHVPFALVGQLRQPRTFSLHRAEAEQARTLFQDLGLAASGPAQVLRKVNRLLELGDALGDINGFIIEWLHVKKACFEQDVQELRNPPKAAAAQATVVVEDKAVLVEVAEEDETVETAAAAAARMPVVESKAAPGTVARDRRFQDFYRFVDGRSAPRPVTAAFRVGRNAARIRAQVAERSGQLTSARVVSLVKALEPYGARCEGDRKKGIMIKLPTGRPEQPFVAKFIHRSHAAHDGFDCHSADALKELFDASVFTLDTFSPGAH
jgi:hypothetical protein